MRGIKPFLSDAWYLAAPYFRSEERWSARLLLASIISMNLMLVGMNVILNFWNGAFYDSLQAKDWDSFVSLLFLGKWSGGATMPGFVLIVSIYIPIAIYRTYLNQWLQIRWRRWMTSRVLDDWLSDQAYYRIQLSADPSGLGTDNPDQRIADDIRSFVTDSLTLGLGLLSNVVSLFNFTLILWSLSGAITVLGLTIPGYMVWVALGYAAIGTWLTHLVGKPLVKLNFDQERYEADFRFALVRLRENTEGVALYHGENEEKKALKHRFSNVVFNWWGIMRRTKLLNALTFGYNQVANIFPIAVASPRYFSGEIALGGLTRISSAFGHVQDSLSWFVNAYSSLASWRATVIRLSTFIRAVELARLHSPTGIEMVQGGEDLEIHDANLQLPDGSALLDIPRLIFPRDHSTLVQGRSGSGKSTLFRAVAGIWPFGEGRVERPAGTLLFLPQRPYIPLGTLRHAVTYPAGSERFTDDQVRQALVDSGLEGLSDRLDEDQPWAQRLSGGEQQRLAFARALLLRPDWLFLDEATASLDPRSEADLYRTLQRQLPASTIVSIAHRESVAQFHDRQITVTRQPGQAGTLETA